MHISVMSLIKPLTRFIQRFHVVIFVVIITSGLAALVLLLNNVIITSSSSEDYMPSSNTASFDQATIDRVKQLKTRSETNGQLDLPEGRTSPFIE